MQLTKSAYGFFCTIIANTKTDLIFLISTGTAEKVFYKKIVFGY